MKSAYPFAIGLLFLWAASVACGGLTTAPTERAGADTPAATAGPAATLAPGAEANGSPSAQPVTEAGPDATATRSAVPTIEPTATTALLKLEVVQTQIWNDPQGNTRATVLLHNPYDFPVEPSAQSSANIFNAAGDRLRGGKLIFSEGVSNSRGYFLPGETLAAFVCFTCEAALLTETWAAIEFGLPFKEATGTLAVSTEVAPTISAVTFYSAEAVFDFTGAVTNNSGGNLQRISVRVVVFDQNGQLVGAGEGAAYDVAAGATAAIDSYGIGQAPDGPYTYEVSALGVNY